MSEEQIPPGITAEDWAATPLAVQQWVVSLLETVVALQKRVAELEERVNQTSRNSSKPPSSDPPNAPPRPKSPPSGREAGGQPGHVGHGRSLKPVAQVKHVVVARPTACAACGALLLGEDAQPVRHQVTELPRIEPEVTEYQRHTLTCLACGAPTQAPWPSAMPTGSFGPRAQATVGYVTGRLGVSQRDADELLETVFHTDLSLGSVPALEQDVSAAVAQPVAEAQTYVQRQPVNNVDETSWPERAHRGWLWVTATPLVTVFLLLATRGTDSAKKVLGAAFQGIVGSDRWSGYNWLDPARRQLCWAHLKRDFQAFVDRSGEAERIGRALLDCVEQLFGLWHRVRDGTLSRTEFQAAVQPIQNRVGDLLREGAQLPPGKTSRTCAKILKLEVALWTFVRVEGVEPTNNGAERPLRRAVVWRRRSFWTQSADGSRFVERILTVVTTLRQQHRDVLDYLTEACAAAIRGDSPPSLLPKPSAFDAVT
jgi:hypothetical protein